MKINESPKNGYFPKRLTHAFGPKMAIFPTFFLGNIGQGNVFYDILERKNACLGYKDEEFKKSKNWDFPMLLVQKWPYFQLFFLGNIGQKNEFYDILELKNACQGYKNNKFQKAKNWDFSKGVNLCFWSKNDHFSNFFF